MLTLYCKVFFIFVRVFNIGKYALCISDTSDRNARASAIRSSKSFAIQVAYILALHVPFRTPRETKIRFPWLQCILRIYKRRFSYMLVAITHVSYGI